MTAPDPIDWKAVALAALLIALFLMALGGCEPRREDVFTQPQPKELKPLTVTPHPKFGFDLVIIPAGTDIDGFTTIEPGLYLAGDGLRHVLREMGLTGEYFTKDD